MKNNRLTYVLIIPLIHLTIVDNKLISIEMIKIITIKIITRSLTNDLVKRSTKLIHDRR